ncbi:M20 family metallopeptidase [Streptomyces rubiginosohelvolus]|uniref:M20 family metallopeptidase n=1 Tax=Streptomyces rubiginosohelvolus TaxID=67362 RepID=UPI0036B6A0D4
MSDVLDQVLADLSARRTELTDLLGSLVQAHPVYATPGQSQALDIAARHLAGSGLQVRTTEVSLPRLSASPHYVDVPSFGGEFARYGDVPRTGLTATRRFGADGPHVALNGHVDVEFVTAPQNWSEPGLWSSGAVRGDRVYGRGTSDMLGGVACYLYTLRSLAPHWGGAQGAVSVQLVLDEELGGNGTLWQLLTMRGPRPDMALIAEPSDGRICGRTRGFHQFRIVCQGDPVHMVFAHEYDNAVRVAADVLLVLEDLNAWISNRYADITKGRFVLCGALKGGTDAAVSADMVELFVTLALPPELSPDRVEEHLAGLLAALDLPRTPTVHPYGVSFPGNLARDDRLTNVLLDAGRAVGVDVTTGEFPSACDARLFDAYDIPVAVFGPGSLTRAHSSDEYVRVDELADYCEVLAAGLTKLWGLR